MGDEDFSWLVRWARVLRKIKDGATEEHAVSLTPGECADLARGIKALMKESCYGAGGQ